MTPNRLLPTLAITVCLAGCARAAPYGHCADEAAPKRNEPQPAVAKLLMRFTRSTEWRLVQTVPLRGFRCFHPEGLARDGDHFILATTEVLDPPHGPFGAADRHAGNRGMGHIFKFDGDGRLLAQATVGQGLVYHPGGIDFDGENVWVPVAEYRPLSKSIVYRVDPRSLAATEAFRVDDHIGAIVRDRGRGGFIGMNWGSRRFFRWDAQGKLLGSLDNPSLYVEYQDCKYLGGTFMACGSNLDLPRIGALATLTKPQLGGLALLDIEALPHVVHEWPILTESPGPGHEGAHVLITSNALFFEARGETLRLYTVPDDDGDLLVFEASPPT